jgi:hypothetical protein
MKHTDNVYYIYTPKKFTHAQSRLKDKLTAREKCEIFICLFTIKKRQHTFGSEHPFATEIQTYFYHNFQKLSQIHFGDIDCIVL